MSITISKTVCFDYNEEPIIQKKKFSLKILIKTRIWMLRKISAVQREKLRNARIERQLIQERSQLICFQYIVNRAEKSRIFFGSGIKRETLPETGPALSPFMRRICSEQKDASPGDYEIALSLIKKLPTKSGYSTLTNRTPRFSERKPTTKVPPVGTYDLYKPPFKLNDKPFGVGAINEMKPKLITPGPGTYKIYKKKDNIIASFGSKQYIIPAVKIICSPQNLSICKICGKVPLGDYYNYSSKYKNEDMCRPCMEVELQEIKSCATKLSVKRKKKSELDKFSLARYCGFHHEHNGTQASVKLMKRKHLTSKLRTENYLSLFKI